MSNRIILTMLLAALPVACGGRTTSTAAPAPAAPAATTAPGPDAIAPALALETFDTAWTRIARSHYDSTFGGLDWNGVRAELRPRAARATTYTELRGLLTNMLRRIGDSHYGLIPRGVADAVETNGGGGAGDVGAELRIAEGSVVVWRVDPGGPAAARGIRPGWIVDAIDARRPAQELEALRALEGTPEARIAHTQFLRSLNVALDGRPGESVHLILRDGQDRPVEADLVRRTRPGTPVQFGNLPPLVADLAHHRIELQNACVGVIRFNIWMVIPLSAAFDRAIDTMRDCAGIVVDIRGNPGGVAGMVIGVAGHFYDTDQTLGELTMRTGELRLYANPRRVDTDGDAVVPFRGPVAVLTDALSVSTSEIFAAAIQVTERGRIFGETTAGQALPATAVRLPSGDVLMHVVADLTAPDGSRIEGNGVTPDRVVPLRRVDLLEGRDAPLDAAVRWILNGPGDN